MSSPSPLNQFIEDPDVCIGFASSKTQAQFMALMDSMGNPFIYHDFGNYALQNFPFGRYRKAYFPMPDGKTLELFICFEEAVLPETRPKLQILRVEALGAWRRPWRFLKYSVDCLKHFARELLAGTLAHVIVLSVGAWLAHMAVEKFDEISVFFR